MLPRVTYGSWETAELALYHQAIKRLTYVLMLNGHNYRFEQRDRAAISGGVGAYFEWGRSLYSYSAISVASAAEFLPLLRTDHTLHFHTLAGSNWHLTLSPGLTYVFDRTFNPDDPAGPAVNRHDLTPFGGVLFALHKWEASAEIFLNLSFPGSIVSVAGLITLGYSWEGHHATFLSGRFGGAGYLAIAANQDVRQRLLEVTLKHRRWLTANFGIFGVADYVNLQNGYDKVGFKAGLFFLF